jgi:hypothetical protein
MGTFKARLVLLLILVLVGAGLIVSQIHHKETTPGTLTVQSNIPIADDATILIDDNPLETNTDSETSATYSLSPGTHSVSISQAGYKQFSRSVTVRANETTTIYAALVLTHTPPAISSAALGFGSPISLGAVVYFYDNTWAVCQLQQPNTDPAYVIAQYTPSNDKWSVVEGPGTEFDSDSLTQLPQKVATYVQNNLSI